MPATLSDVGDDAIVTAWAEELNDALQVRDQRRLAALFTDDGCLRDMVALTWHFHTYFGSDEVARRLLAAGHESCPRGFRLAGTGITKTKVKPDGTSVVESILDFDTRAGAGQAVLRLVNGGDGGYRAWVLSTVLTGLRDYPERTGDNRIVGTPSLDTFSAENWLDRRQDEVAYRDHEPEVLVVGAGQSGLAIAARLRALGVDTLVIDRLPRVGDVWRNRYHSLTLHNPVWLNHLPYMPFPETWPVYIPKDKLANWFESYADAMELNIWAATELVEASYDDSASRWSVTLSVGGTKHRVIRPAHIVMATGASGIPRWPDIPGLSSYRGVLQHSASFEGGARTTVPKHAVIFGTGNSGHDVAQDLFANGSHVTMVQRGSTTIVDISTVHAIYDRYSKRLSPEQSDLMLVATPYQHSVEAFRAMTQRAKQRDAELISRLHSVGFRTDYGEDESGHRMKFLRHGGGYYINVGGSDLIANQQIDLLQYEQLDRVVEDGVRLRDGTTLAADLIVMATGYENQQVLVERVFGADVAARVGPIWGYDAEGEMRGMYKRTPQPGLWFHAGGLTQSRVYSRLVALQIKACLAGLINP